ncbi:hypothetical protein FCV25MIE_34005 [Fagus crenata]
MRYLLGSLCVVVGFFKILAAQSAIAQARPLLTLFGRAHMLTWRARCVNSGLSHARLSGMLEISSSMRAYYCPHSKLWTWPHGFSETIRSSSLASI